MNPNKNTTKKSREPQQIKKLRNLTQQICHLSVHCCLVN